MNKLDIEERSIDKIYPYENNPRRNDDAVEYVAKSITEYGWQQPIVIDKDGIIVVGHTRYKAAKSLGLKTVPVHVIEGLTDEQIKAYRIADNKTSDYSFWDNALLLQELESLGDDFFTGFETSEMFDFKWDEADNSILEDTPDGAYYELKIRSTDLEMLEKTKEFYEGGCIEG